MWDRAWVADQLWFYRNKSDKKTEWPPIVAAPACNKSVLPKRLTYLTRLIGLLWRRSNLHSLFPIPLWYAVAHETQAVCFAS